MTNNLEGPTFDVSRATELWRFPLSDSAWKREIELVTKQRFYVLEKGIPIIIKTNGRILRPAVVFSPFDDRVSSLEPADQGKYGIPGDSLEDIMIDETIPLPVFTIASCSDQLALVAIRFTAVTSPNNMTREQNVTVMRFMSVFSLCFGAIPFRCNAKWHRQGVIASPVWPTAPNSAIRSPRS